MDALNFAYWLQGYFELSHSGGMSPEQVKVIKDHLALIFEKKTPTVTINPPIILPAPDPTRHDWRFDPSTTPICSPAPKIDFDGREPDIYCEKAAEDIFPPTYGVGYTNGSLEPHELKSLGKPPASC